MTEAGWLEHVLTQVRLIQPWTIAACAGVTALLVVVLWWTRTRHLPRNRRLLPLLAGLIASTACWAFVDLWWRPFGDPIGWGVWCWVGAVVVVLVQAATGPRRRGDAALAPRRRRLVRAAASSLAVVTALACALLAINAAFAAYPSAAAALGLGLHVVPLAEAPGTAWQSPRPRADGPLETTWRAPAGTPGAGLVVSAPIPAGSQAGTDGFAPRMALIYLPPAYLSSDRPLLPVLVLMPGQPGSPADWFEMGGLQATMDAYAAAHDGLAPVVVVIDEIGRPLSNPLCSDTVAGGRVATYVEQDVPSWIRTHLQVDPDPRSWAVAGLSNGATCALQVVSRSPETYHAFLAMSPEEHVSLGSVERTIDKGFAGSTGDYEANDPLSILAGSPAGRYAGTAGIISAGTGDTTYGPARSVLVDATRAAGMSTESRTYDGGHTWAVWQEALADQLPWLGDALGISR